MNLAEMVKRAATNKRCRPTTYVRTMNDDPPEPEDDGLDDVLDDAPSTGPHMPEDD